MQYKFRETELEHAKRLGGNIHRTRQLRRAITHILTGHIYSESAWYLVAKGLGELCKMAAVKLEGGMLIPHGVTTNREFITALVGQLKSTADPAAPQRARAKLLTQGLLPGKGPYPYSGRHGRVNVNDRAREIVTSTFTTLGNGGSYADVASHLNNQGYLTATGKKWSKGAARSFCQNPIHAGFATSYIDRRTDGTSNKRGGLLLTRIIQGMPEPLIDWDTFLACNPVMREREIVFVRPEIKLT